VKSISVNLSPLHGLMIPVCSDNFCYYISFRQEVKNLLLFFFLHSIFFFQYTFTTTGPGNVDPVAQQNN